MTSSNKPTPPNFDRVATGYRWAEYIALGSLLQRTRTALLPRVLGCGHALLLGDGDGRFTARLLASAPHMVATAVDTSTVMLKLLRRRCRTAGDRLSTVHASALGFLPPTGTDLIVTHFFLDCLPQASVDHLVQTIAAAVAPGTLWLVSDFALPAPAPLRLVAALYIRSLYAAFRLLTGLQVRQLPDPQSPLKRNGFQRIARWQQLGGFLYAELWVLRPD